MGAKRWPKRGVAIAGGLALAAGVMVVTAGPASADPVSCQNVFPDRPGGYCAQVTGIDAGSSLVLHNGPDYTSGVVDGSGHYTDGTWLKLYCWTTGAADADGHGDTYWFNADDNNGNIGFVNDWYVTSGGFSTWSKVINHC
ncbi:hypothetical protein AV521_36140 [Streptomyces sp. IMTB 2501]|uniref:hypothetical protein n=1 Tax=Streptomyces sp. IMTB 2501 TaxID=1776340 RepID=UPI00096F2148|nr:hypothetical protein [Streptomyces sp. IMTB 2501]OLZ64222.1 hypothetical protein AV521_36140 [Streptomyces sp. IMTB 2501]